MTKNEREKLSYSGWSAYIRAEYNNLEKPFIIEGRDAHCGGTDYWTIARLTEDNARLLLDEGLPMRDSDFDWGKHWEKMELYRARRDAKVAADKLAALEANMVQDADHA
jgi:hypothetical protein